MKYLIIEIDMVEVKRGDISLNEVIGGSLEEVRYNLLSDEYGLEDVEIIEDSKRWKKEEKKLYVDNEESVIIIKEVS